MSNFSDHIQSFKNVANALIKQKHWDKEQYTALKTQNPPVQLLLGCLLAYLSPTPSAVFDETIRQIDKDVLCDDNKRSLSACLSLYTSVLKSIYDIALYRNDDHTVSFLQSLTKTFEAFDARDHAMVLTSMLDHQMFKDLLKTGYIPNFNSRKSVYNHLASSGNVSLLEKTMELFDGGWSCPTVGETLVYSCCANDIKMFRYIAKKMPNKKVIESLRSMFECCFGGLNSNQEKNLSADILKLVLKKSVVNNNVDWVAVFCRPSHLTNFSLHKDAVIQQLIQLPPWYVKKVIKTFSAFEEKGILTADGKLYYEDLSIQWQKKKLLDKLPEMPLNSNTKRKI